MLGAYTACVSFGIISIYERLKWRFFHFSEKQIPYNKIRGYARFFDLFLPRDRQREMKLPIIDLNALSPNDLVDAVRRACETNGFFILRNHSVRQATIREMRDASELFYALPVDVKMKAKQNANNRG